MLGGQQEPVGQQARPAVQRPLRSYPRQFRKVIALGQMGKNYVGRLAVVLILKERSGCLVRKVTHPREHPLLH